MLDMPYGGPRETEGGAGIARRSFVNGGLVVVPDPSKERARAFLARAATNLSAVIRELGWRRAKKLLPLGEQTIMQKMLRASSPPLHWAVFGQRYVGLGCRSVPFLDRQDALLGHAVLQRRRLDNPAESTRLKVACMREMEGWVHRGRLENCFSAWKMDSAWVRSHECLHACPPLPDFGTNCTCRDRRRVYPAICKKGVPA